MRESAHMLDIFNSKWDRTMEKGVKQSGKRKALQYCQVTGFNAKIHEKKSK